MYFGLIQLANFWFGTSINQENELLTFIPIYFIALIDLLLELN